MPLVSLESLLACLDVREHDAGRWSAPNLDLDYHRVFGGQLLAQAIAVAAATVSGAGDGDGAEKMVKSIAALFPREGSTGEPFDLDVERTQDGRTFATRRIHAVQQGKTFFVATVSLHAHEDGLEHDMPPSALGAPDSDPGEATPTELTMIPWETRVVDGADLADRAAAPPAYAFWTRVADRTLADDLFVHQALLAHATDLSVIGTALRPHDGYGQGDVGTRLVTAVTSHSLWFHRPFRIDDWCLVAQHAPVTAGGRGFGLGHAWDADRRLVASFAQESMIRLIGT